MPTCWNAGKSSTNQCIMAARTAHFDLELTTNWKLAVENYCESYHLPWVHPGLNSYSRLEDHYHIQEPNKYSGQGTLVYQQLKGPEDTVFPDFKALDDKWNTGAEYIAIYPNVLLGAQRDHCFSIILQPNTADQHDRAYPPLLRPTQNV